MKAVEIEKFCLSLPGSTVIEQWGGCRVFKVGGKMFAILGPKGEHALQGLSLKVGEDSFHILVQEKNIIPAPYLARAKWVSLQKLDALGSKQLRAYLSRAHAIIVSGLPKKKQAELDVSKIEVPVGSSLLADILALGVEDLRAGNVRPVAEAFREIRKRVNRRTTHI